MAADVERSYRAADAIAPPHLGPIAARISSVDVRGAS
jgi:hypothetical protein